MYGLVRLSVLNPAIIICEVKYEIYIQSLEYKRRNLLLYASVIIIATVSITSDNSGALVVQWQNSRLPRGRPGFDSRPVQRNPFLFFSFDNFYCRTLFSTYFCQQQPAKVTPLKRRRFVVCGVGIFARRNPNKCIKKERTQRTAFCVR